MLRVGLTGELGSGKTTVAQMLAERGAIVISSDDMARTMMQPGEAVYQSIVEHFGPDVLNDNGTLDRRELARLAFDPLTPRIEELNAIIHPAVLALQEILLGDISRIKPGSVVVIESALIFSTHHATIGPEFAASPWRQRFDQIVVVKAPVATKVQRFVERSTGGRTLPPDEVGQLEEDARRRLRAQHVAEEQQAGCLVLLNDGTLTELAAKVDAIWAELQLKLLAQVQT